VPFQSKPYNSRPYSSSLPYAVMPRLFLLGGENVARRSAKTINAAALESACSHPRVLVFPWARPSFDSRYSKRKLFIDYMRSLGAAEVTFAEYGEDEDLAKQLSLADVAYFTGGQASVLVERGLKEGLDKLLQDFSGVVVGRSAGALAMCNRCVTTIREKKRVRMVKGLGLVHITLKAHYTSEKDEALKRFSQKEMIFAVPKDSALVCDDGHLSAIGEVYVFNEGQRNRFIDCRL
jgi:dipeptidase E